MTNTKISMPGTPQGILLGMLSLVTVAAAILLAPVLPTIVAHFAPTDANAEAKVILAMTAPALMVAIASSFVGSIIDRIGRKTVLVWSLLIYGCIGMLPAFIESLNFMIGSRIVLGIFEAFIMTTSTTLIGDYFIGKERQKWIIMQTVFVAISGVFFIILGGILGQISWNAPFYAYGIFLIGVPFVIFLLHEPEKHESEPEAGDFPWKNVLGLYAFGLVSAVLFLVVPIQLPFLLTERGITSPLTIGMTNTGFSVAVLVGSLLFSKRAEASFKMNLSGAFIFIGIGLLLLVGTGDYWVTVAGAILAGLGAGFVLPTLVTEIMRHLPFELRGRGTGRWQTAYFLGNFGSPLIVLAITVATGTLSNSLMIMAAVALIAALLVALFVRNPGSSEQ